MKIEDQQTGSNACLHSKRTMVFQLITGKIKTIINVF